MPNCSWQEGEQKNSLRMAQPGLYTSTLPSAGTGSGEAKVLLTLNKLISGLNSCWEQAARARLSAPD